MGPGQKLAIGTNFMYSPSTIIQAAEPPGGGGGTVLTLTGDGFCGVIDALTCNLSGMRSEAAWPQVLSVTPRV